MKRFKLIRDGKEEKSSPPLYINCDSYNINHETAMYDFIGKNGNKVFSIKMMAVLAIEPVNIPEVTEGIQRGRDFY